LEEVIADFLPRKNEILLLIIRLLNQPMGNNVGVHELALQLGTINNQIVYPVLCVLNEKNEIILQYNNYLSPTDFKILLEKLKE
jgi:hypothetical protein